MDKLGYGQWFCFLDCQYSLPFKNILYDDISSNNYFAAYSSGGKYSKSFIYVLFPYLYGIPLFFVQ